MMKLLKPLAALLCVVILVVAWVAPIGPLPGIFIGGSATEAPASWGDTSQIDEITLEVQGTVPRVVTIWVVQVDGDLHVVGSKKSGWVRMLGSGGIVRMRMGDDTYSLHAHLLTEGWKPVLEAYVAKYRPNYPEIVAGFPPPEEAEAFSSVYRLRRQ